MDNIQTVQQIYAAFGRADIPGIMEHLAEDVRWDDDQPDHGIKWLTPRHGRAQVMEFFRELGAGLSFQRFDVTNLLAGGDQVVGIAQVEHTDNSTGKPFKDVELHIFTFDAKGRLTRFRHVLDTHQMWLQGRA